MKQLIAIVAATIAMSAMAADTPKTEVKSTPAAGVTAPAAPAKNETKPVKSEKKDSTKVEAKAPTAK